MLLRSVITYVPYTSPLMLMMYISLSYSMWVCMKEFRMSIVPTYQCSPVSTMHVISADLVVTFGELYSSLDMKSLCLFPPAIVLPFRVLYLFSLRKMWDSRIVFLCSLVKSFLCRGMNFSLIWICFIYKWTDNLPLSPHFLRPVLSESWFMMTAVMSGSFWVSPQLKNT